MQITEIDSFANCRAIVRGHNLVNVNVPRQDNSGIYLCFSANQPPGGELKSLAIVMVL